jgi:hypothetical protein
MVQSVMGGNYDGADVGDRFRIGHTPTILAGAVFLMNVTDPAEAHALLEKLPLGQAYMMTYQLIPVGPLWPLGLLLGEPAK